MRTFLGIFAIVIGIYSYIPYFRDIVAGRTKPHAFSWFVWALLTGIAFFAQLHGKGGAGAWVTDDPVGSVILITIIDALAFVPTFRKSYHKPNEETASTYSLSALKFAVAIAALSTVSVTTALYPLSLVVTNGVFVMMLLSRRKRLTAATDAPY